MGRRVIGAVVAVVVSGFAATASLAATVGDFDPTFNSGSPLQLAAPPPGASPTVDQQIFDTAVVDTQNRITLGGSIHQQESPNPLTQLALLARVTPGGALDSTFGSGGLKIATPYDGGQTMTALRFGIDSQLRLTGAFETDQDLLGARLVDNGGLDVTGYAPPHGFAAAAPTMPIEIDALQTVAIGPDGSTYFIYYATSDRGATTNDIRVSRIDPSGNVDTGYGAGPTNDGLITVPRDLVAGTGPVVAAVDSQNRLVVALTSSVSCGAGCNRRQASVIRLTPTGVPDTTWGTGASGLFNFAAPGPTGVLVRDVAIAPGDQVVVEGQIQAGNFDSFADELTNTGTQSAFGFVDTPVTDATKVAVQPDGKVLLAGIGADNGDFFTTIVRYTTAGALDPTFGHMTCTPACPGVVQPTLGIVPVNGLVDADALAVSPDGSKLVIVGDVGTSTSNLKPFVERFLLQDPSLAPELLTAPKVTGSPVPGQTLTCNPGMWTNSPTIQVFWDRAPGSTTSPSDPAWTQLPTLGTHYTPTAADLGSRIRCREHASNANDPQGVDGPSNSLRVEAGVPVLVAAPSISGLPIVDQSMRCDTGQWTNDPDLGVQWLRDGSPIPNATAADYTLQAQDHLSHVSCQVTAANDVGPAAVPARSSNDALVVAGVPTNDFPPQVVQSSTGPKPTDLLLTCRPGVWADDYGEHDYEWERSGSVIAGETGTTYAVTVADLGQDIDCVEFSTNPAGRSSAATSPQLLVPLPSTGQPGAIYTAGGGNEIDPVNFMAVTQGWLNAVSGLVVARKQAAAASARTTCQTSNPNAPLPSFASLTSSVIGVYMSPAQTCGVLLHAPADQIIYPPGGSIYWTGAGGCRQAPGGGKNPCPELQVVVPVLNPATPPSSLSPLEVATLDAIKPVEVLWDFNGDGKTDAICDPDAPIVRTLPSRGDYNVHAVIVSADSAQTGLYSVTSLPYSYFPTSPNQAGTVRSAQPFACETSLEPPPDKTQPCINSATIGRTHVSGNICPISARSVPEADFAGLPADVQQVLENQSLTGALRSTPSTLPTDYSFGLRAAPLSTAYLATTQISALSTFGNIARAATVPAPWAAALKKLPFFNLANAQYAMDQVYVIKGAAKINGIDFSPVGDALTVMVPSDVGQAIADVKQMTISNRDVATALGGIPLGDAGPMSSDITDAVNAAAPTLRDVNLDALKASLLPKLDLGPFKLAGDAQLRMASDGTAFIDAQAQLKGPFSTGAGPIRAAVTVHADLNGNLSLQGVHLEVPQALLGAVTVSGLKIDYDSDNGLNIQGALLFPPVNDGIQINDFRVDSHGDFKELDVSFLAGTGQGIDIGPGLFLVKLQGGLSLDPDEINAGAGISVGPSAGGGCPTAGIDSDFVVHWGPPPFFVDAKGTVELVCIPIGNVHFHADSTGLVTLAAMVNLDVGPLHLDAGVNGELRLPDWQVDAHGDGSIDGLISGVSVKALISNLGLAGCVRVPIFPATPFNDTVYLSGGAGVHFHDDIPPLSFPELAAALKLFTGCDLTSWSPFGRDARAAAADGSATFTLGKNAPKVEGLQIVGAGGAPKVQIVTPAGKTLDASGFGTQFTRTDDLSGLLDPANSRTVLFIRGAPGVWTIRPVPGSVPISSVMHAEVVPAPKITAHVGGTGASRTLRYHVVGISGQIVHFVEQSNGGQRAIKAVIGGGDGIAHFVTSEGKGTKRTIVAQVSQGGIPRENIVVAHFTAPSPRAATPRVTVRRHGPSVTVSWNRAQFAATYLVTVQTGRGRRLLLMPKAGAHQVSFGGLMTGEGAVVTVVGVTAGGHRGTARTVRVSGALNTTTVTKKNRWQTAASKKKKTKPKK